MSFQLLSQRQGNARCKQCRAIRKHRSRFTPPRPKPQQACQYKIVGCFENDKKNFKHIQGYAHVKFKNQKAMERLKYLSQTQCTVHFMTVADPGIHAPYPPLMRTYVKKILAQIPCTLAYLHPVSGSNTTIVYIFRTSKNKYQNFQRMRFLSLCPVSVK